MTAGAYAVVPAQSPAPGRVRSRVAARWGWIFGTMVLLAWGATVVIDFRTAMAGLALMGFAGALLGLRAPTLGMLGIGVLCTLDGLMAPLLLQGGLWRWNTLNYWLLGAMIYFAPLLLRRRDLQTRLLQLFLVWLTVGLIPSVDVAAGMQHVLGIGVTFGLLAYFARSTRNPDAWFWFGAVNGLLAAAGTLAYLRQAPALPPVNPNVWSQLPLAGMLAVLLGFTATRGNPKRQLLLVALAVVNGVWIFLSGSRGNLLIALIALGGLTLMAQSLRRGAVLALLAVLLAAGLVTQFPALEHASLARLELLADARESARTRSSGRVDLALGGWYIFREHPAIGAGTGSFSRSWATLGRREGMSGFRRGREAPAHSAWVKVLAENGAPGVALLMLYVGSFAVAGRRTRQRRLWVLGVTAAAIVGCALLTMEFQSKSLWLFAAGAMALLAAGRPGRRRKAAP